MASEKPSAPFYLTGAYAPVLKEETRRDLEVAGEIPPDLCGTYLRNGPNPRSGSSPAWLAAAGMLHGVRLESGRAKWYRNRWMTTERSPNTSVIAHAGRILALVETQLPVEVDAELGTVGRFDFAGGLRRPMIAHPKTCPNTGELLSLSYGREAPHLIYYRADAAGRLVHEAPIRVPAMTFVHDMGITERHVVFWDMPVLVGDWQSAQPLRWSEDYRSRIGVLRRDGRDEDVAWFDVQPGFISHCLNAYEDGDCVFLDVVRAPRLMTACELYRYALDLRTGRATEHVLDSRFIDFPRIHPAFAGRPVPVWLRSRALRLEHGELAAHGPTEVRPRHGDVVDPRFRLGTDGGRVCSRAEARGRGRGRRVGRDVRLRPRPRSKRLRHPRRQALRRRAHGHDSAPMPGADWLARRVDSDDPRHDRE